MLSGEQRGSSVADGEIWTYGFAILWSLVKLLCELLTVGGGTNSLHEVHPVRVPRWSFCKGEILKPGLQAAPEASSLSWEVKTSIPLSDVNGGDEGAGRTLLCPANLWEELDSLGNMIQNTKYEPGYPARPSAQIT